ncbi:MAG: hypothetical protein HQL35_01020 [Alphaproteobacteria bacterium]|nr:hypothetical protein [Alphaproteobacteria bacterium]
MGDAVEYLVLAVVLVLCVAYMARGAKRKFSSGGSGGGCGGGCSSCAPMPGSKTGNCAAPPRATAPDGPDAKS